MDEQDKSFVISKCLLKYHVPQGCAFTHLNLGRPGGRYYIDSQHMSEFMKLYCEAVDNGCDLYLSEKNRHTGPVKVDFDFKFDAPNDVDGVQDTEKKKQHVGKQLKTKNIEEIVSVYIQTLKEFFDIEDHEDELLTAYVTERKGVVATNDNKIKEGFHLMFPHIVSKASVQYILRQTIIPRLAPLFEKMNCINSPDDIVDEAIIERNNWMMYGSKKFGREPYLLTKIFEVQECTPESIRLQCIKVPKDHKISEYVDLLSIRNKYDETKVKKKWTEPIQVFEIQQEERRKKMEISREIIMEKNNETKNESSDVDISQVEKLVSILDVKRIESYEGWIRLGWCLRNIDHRLLYLWEDASKRSSKFVEGECETAWIKMRSSGLGLGTLHMWAKEDNRDAYNDIIYNELRALIKKSLSGTHTDIAHVIRYMYRHKFVCTSIKFKSWYEFKNHRWHYCDNGVSLRMCISDEVWAEYMTASSEWSRRAIDMETEDDKIRCQEVAKKMNAIAGKLKTVSFKESLMRESMELFYVPGFEELLDMDNHLIGFENGVYNLETEEFRDGTPEDHISLSTGCDYIPYEPNHRNVQAIRNYMSQVFTKGDVREYVFKLFASFLHGSVKDQKFYIWTGSGSNSKSLLVDLFMKSFGQYCCVFPVTLLTTKRVASNAANSEVAMAKGKRFALMSEPSDDEKINVGLMKELSGGDKIIARRLYHEPIQFEPQFKMVLLCNNIPPIETDDGGTWRRIRVVEFASKFVDQPKEENEFPIDYDLKSHMVRWRPYFMSMLLNYYKIYKLEGMHEPEDVMKCTHEYKRNNDHMSDFVYSCIEKKDGASLSLNEAFSELKSWVRDDNISMKIPTKPDLQKYLSKVLVKSVTKNNVLCFPGYRLKSQANVCEDENEPHM